MPRPVTMEADAVALPCPLPPRGHGLLHTQKRVRLDFSSSRPNLHALQKGAIQQVIGLDLFARSTEQP